MSKIFPLSLFPDQFFPDVSLKEVRLTESVLEIEVTDSEWALEDKIVFFYGPGVMTFAYSGPPRCRWRTTSEHDWKYVSTPDMLKQFVSFDMILIDDKYWSFRFRPERQEYIAEIALEKITRITWSGEGEDLEEEE